MAKELIDVAAAAGADAVKFQSFKAESSISRYAPKAQYQLKTTAQKDSQLSMVKKLELTHVEHQVLLDHCKHRNIQFLSTPFDIDSVTLVSDVLQVPMMKIASGEIANAPLLLAIAQKRKPIILSTGMSTLGEIELALGVIAFGYLQLPDHPSLELFHKSFCDSKGQELLQKKVTLLHCTTEYPAPYYSVNLSALRTLSTAFGLPVGLSDHTCGVQISIAAVALGATIIEKHFTLDKSLPGPDHQASLAPDELIDLVRMIRDVESAWGSPRKLPAQSEQKNINIARKSLVAKRTISKGEVFSPDNLTVKRPGTGVSPMYYWSYMGKIAMKDYAEDEVIL